MKKNSSFIIVNQDIIGRSIPILNNKGYKLRLRITNNGIGMTGISPSKKIYYDMFMHKNNTIGWNQQLENGETISWKGDNKSNPFQYIKKDEFKNISIVPIPQILYINDLAFFNFMSENWIGMNADVKYNRILKQFFLSCNGVHPC